MIIFKALAGIITAIGMLIIICINVFCSFIKDFSLLVTYGLLNLFYRKRDKTNEEERQS